MGTRFVSAAYALPSRTLTNEELSEAFPKWSPDAILAKTGIRERRVLAPNECGSELAFQAALEALRLSACRQQDIDFLFVVTETPDYVFPATACLLQDRLGLPRDCAAIDINLGCSGLVYAAALATSWLTAGFGRIGLVVTMDCYSRIIDESDSACRPLFGDAAAALVVTAGSEDEGIASFVFGTDGGESNHMMVEGGGFREPPRGAVPRIRMNGPGMFAFAIRVVPPMLARCLDEASLAVEDVDFFLFHQANAYMLNHLQKIMGLPSQKVPVRMEYVGNTVSSSLALLLVDVIQDGTLMKPANLLFAGFGVGASWGACCYRFHNTPAVNKVDMACRNAP